ncbi:autotransporter outer membrane beta-barrel domain-containing protein [Mesorhizobium sp. 1B3]|uniref:autotransporter family protein n=1 Tax=Mesorhizobium sp. 1B3 TaxID=3243599 RepID=UPI003D984B4D
MLLLAAAPASATCTFAPGPGDSSYVCDSGVSAGGLTDMDGNNTLTFPAAGSGTLNGNVVFGAGRDRIEMQSGTIAGTVDQGQGDDSFVIGGGAVAGNIQQGAGLDSFHMTGGTIQSLNQGENLDDFFMSGGHIIDFVEDGDRAVMTGGRVGRVDMKAADNLFDMSGGTIDRNLVAGFGNDTIILSGGTIGGNISVSAGTDSVTITGGSVAGDVLMSTGADTFTWDGGGTVAGTVDLGQDDDTATLRNLGAGQIGGTATLTGNLGNDRLTFDNVATAGIARFQNWETIGATNGTALTFDGNLVLGDSGSGTGAVAVDASSTLLGGQANGGIAAFTAGRLANVTNAGLIDLTNGGSSATDTFTIAGNYRGDGGSLLLQTELGGDASPSDKLVISGGTASGSTSIGIVNVGGSGAPTEANGILVVEALGGAITAPGAFSLNGSVAAGAYEYLLFRGGTTAGVGENWYLRSALVPTVDPTEPSAPPMLPDPIVPPTPGATRVEGEFVPLYRIETAADAVVPPAAYYLEMATLGTFHERRGEQSLLQSAGWMPATWARMFGQDTEVKWSGTVAPTFDGSLAGFQAGFDIYGSESPSGHYDRAGFFVGYARMSGDLRGQALGWNDYAVGSLGLSGTSIGGYWTHVGPGGWYLDGVMMGTWYNGSTTSSRHVAIDLDGTGFTASLEGGYPIALTPGWTLEPQAQIIWQTTSFDDRHDGFSTVVFDNESDFTGRIGLRLQGDMPDGGVPMKPYLKTNLWHGFGSDQGLDLGGDPIITELDGTSLELGGGVVANLTDKVSLHVTGDYTTNLGGEKRRILEGNIGLTVKW